MTIADSITKHGSCETATAQPSSQRQSVAWLLLCAALFGLGLYILANYLHALAWALVLAIALWPSYKRVAQRRSWLGLHIRPRGERRREDLWSQRFVAERTMRI